MGKETSRNNSAKAQPEQPFNINEVSRVSAGSFVKGDVCSAGDIRIDGRVQGVICSKGKVVVGEKAVLEGTLICVNSDFRGTMKGNIIVRDILSLKSESSIEGEVFVRKFQVELGSRVNGCFHMITEEDFDGKMQGVLADTSSSCSQDRTSED